MLVDMPGFTLLPLYASLLSVSIGVLIKLESWVRLQHILLRTPFCSERAIWRRRIIPCLPERLAPAPAARW